MDWKALARFPPKKKTDPARFSTEAKSMLFACIVVYFELSSAKCPEPQQQFVEVQGQSSSLRKARYFAFCLTKNGATSEDSKLYQCDSDCKKCIRCSTSHFEKTSCCGGSCREPNAFGERSATCRAACAFLVNATRQSPGLTTTAASFPSPVRHLRVCNGRLSWQVSALSRRTALPSRHMLLHGYVVEVRLLQLEAGRIVGTTSEVIYVDASGSTQNANISSVLKEKPLPLNGCYKIQLWTVNRFGSAGFLETTGAISRQDLFASGSPVSPSRCWEQLCTAVSESAENQPAQVTVFFGEQFNHDGMADQNFGVKIFWQGPKSFCYMAKVKPLPSNSCTDKRKTTVYEIIASDNKKLTLTNLHSRCTYEVEVEHPGSLRSAKGTVSVSSLALKVTSLQARQFRLDFPSSKLVVEIAWKWPKVVRRSSSYRICLHKMLGSELGSEAHSKQCQPLAAKSPASANFKGLQPSHPYRAVVTITGDGREHVTKSDFVSPALTPTNVRISRLSPTSAEVTWEYHPDHRLQLDPATVSLKVFWRKMTRMARQTVGLEDIPSKRLGITKRQSANNWQHFSGAGYNWLQKPLDRKGFYSSNLTNLEGDHTYSIFVMGPTRRDLDGAVTAHFLYNPTVDDSKEWYEKTITLIALPIAVAIILILIIAICYTLRSRGNMRLSSLRCDRAVPCTTPGVVCKRRDDSIPNTPVRGQTVGPAYTTTWVYEGQCTPIGTPILGSRVQHHPGNVSALHKLTLSRQNSTDNLEDAYSPALRKDSSSCRSSQAVRKDSGNAAAPKFSTAATGGAEAGSSADDVRGTTTPPIRSLQASRAPTPLCMSAMDSNDEWEIPFDQLHLLDVLQEGDFGLVMKAELVGYDTLSKKKEQTEVEKPLSRQSSTRLKRLSRSASIRKKRASSLPPGFVKRKFVAVKMLKDAATEEDRHDLCQQILLMKRVGVHRHLVSMAGCCTAQEPLCLILEYAPYGNLLHYLRAEKAKRNISPAVGKEEDLSAAHQLHSVQRVRSSNRSLSSECSSEADSPARKNSDRLTSEDLLSFARQIAVGMEYLSSKGVVHRNLTCRSILVGDGHRLKLSDFGITANIDRHDTYAGCTQNRLPIKWMSIEAIFDGVFTVESDVWSYGIVLWEICTMGDFPYPHIPSQQLLGRLKVGYRMDRPEGCGEALYEVMLSCWHREPTLRPSFAQVAEKMEGMVGSEHPETHLSIARKSAVVGDASAVDTYSYTWLDSGSESEGSFIHRPKSSASRQIRAQNQFHQRPRDRQEAMRLRSVNLNGRLTPQTQNTSVPADSAQSSCPNLPRSYAHHMRNAHPLISSEPHSGHQPARRTSSAQSSIRGGHAQQYQWIGNM